MNILQLIEFLIQGLILGGAGLYVTHQYSKKQHQLAEDKFNHTLMMRFSDWYNELNNHLHSIKTLEENDSILTAKELRANHPKLYSKLNDYLNLCAEEKLWYSKGVIDKRVWKSWQVGMDHWYTNLHTLKNLWQSEKENGNYKSYYPKEGDNLFTSIIQ